VLKDVIAVAALYLAIRLGWAGLAFHSGALQPITRASVDERLLSLPKILWFYFSKFLYPAELAVAQHWVVSSASWGDVFLPLIGDLAVFLACGAVVFWRRDRVSVFFLGWMVLGLLLHAQFVPLDLTVAERWFYFSMIGVLGLLGCALDTGKALLKEARGIALVLLTMTVALSVRSVVRAGDWKDGITLFTHDVALNPSSFDLQNNAGVELFRVGRIAEAKEHFEESIRLLPDWWSNWNNLGAVYERLGDLPGAESAYHHVVESSTYYLAYENYAGLLLRENRKDEARQFLEQRALLYFPQNARLRSMYQYLQNH
jgi:tetratricopeptide (TPR) repeat protein